LPSQIRRREPQAFSNQPRKEAWSSCKPIARAVTPSAKLAAVHLKIAPPFRTLHLHYPVEDLQEPLAEGIVTGHPTMPEFRFDPGQVGDVIAYLKTLEQ